MSEGRRYRMTIFKHTRSVGTAEINARTADEAEEKMLNLTREDHTWIRWDNPEVQIEADTSAEEVRE